MITPTANFVPCLGQSCDLGNVILNTSKYIKLRVKEKSWLIDEISKELVAEVNKNDLNCILIANKQLCYSFELTYITKPSFCTKSIWSWNENLIKSQCQFELKEKVSYKPIQILKNIFALHKSEIPYYDMICPSKKLERVNLKIWSEIVVLNQSCFMSSQNIIVEGPINIYSESISELKTPKYIFKSIKNEIPDFSKFGFKDFRKFNVSEFQTNLRMDSYFMSLMVDHLWSSSNFLFDKLKLVENIQEATAFHFSLGAFVNVLSKVISYVVDYVVIMTLLRSGNWLGFGTVLIVEPVSALQIFSVEDLLSSSFIGLIADSISLLIFTIFIAFIYWKRKNNQTILSSFEARILTIYAQSKILIISFDIKRENVLERSFNLIRVEVPIRWIPRVGLLLKNALITKLKTKEAIFVITRKENRLGILL